MTCPPRPSQVRLFLVAGLAVLLAACQDSQVTPVESTPNFDINESRFGDDGNPEFFFASPLAANPQPGDAGFDEGAANALLIPYVRVCETDGAADPLGCTLDVTDSVTGSISGLAMTFNADAELYQTNWQTKGLDESKDYRIEIWGLELTSVAQRDSVDERWLFGWRDIRNSPSTASCDGTEEFCLVNYGQTIPVKVRIERFVFCPDDPSTPGVIEGQNCAVQFVAAGAEANLEAVIDPANPVLSGQLFIPAQNNTNFAIAFEPCSDMEDQDVDDAIDLPTFGPCLKTVTTFTTELLEPAIISICEEFDPSDQLPASQIDQLALHHFTEDGAPDGQQFRVEALPEAFSCAEPTSGGVAHAPSSSRLGQFAQAVAKKVKDWVVPPPLQATAVVLDRGGGGSTGFLNSFFKLVLPGKFERGSPDFQIRPAGSQVTLTARVTDLFGLGVENARVRWNLQSAPGGDDCPDAGVLNTGGICVSAVIDSTDVNGVAEVVVQLSPSEGDNVFHAFGRGIADDRIGFNGPREEFDPFLPLHNDDVFDGSPPMGTESVVAIVEDTRLLFTVFGCVPGRGTPNAVDGVIDAGEWDCANSEQFPVNLSGGSTVQATFYWMNDNDSVHLAVVVPGAERQNGLRIDWDNDGDGVPGGVLEGVRERGDDVWEFDPDTGEADKFIDAKCSDSSQSGCGTDDTSVGGSMDTKAAFRNDLNGVTVYEMSHPLSTADSGCVAKGKETCTPGPIDLQRMAGERAGLFVTLRLGSGAQGNTQWPGFLVYKEITIQ